MLSLSPPHHPKSSSFIHIQFILNFRIFQSILFHQQLLPPYLGFLRVLQQQLFSWQSQRSFPNTSSSCSSFLRGISRYFPKQLCAEQWNPVHVLVDEVSAWQKYLLDYEVLNRSYLFQELHWWVHRCGIEAWLVSHGAQPGQSGLVSTGLNPLQKRGA